MTANFINMLLGYNLMINLLMIQPSYNCSPQCIGGEKNISPFIKING